MSATPIVTQATGSPLVTLTTTSETVALSSGTYEVSSPGTGVLIRATVTGATGAGVTSCQLRVRKGTATSGTLIGGVVQEAQGASSFYSMDISVLDTSAATAAVPSGSVQYSVTVQQVGATGNGTVTLANISVTPVNPAGQ